MGKQEEEICFGFAWLPGRAFESRAGGERNTSEEEKKRGGEDTGEMVLLGVRAPVSTAWQGSSGSFLPVSNLLAELGGGREVSDRTLVTARSTRTGRRKHMFVYFLFEPRKKRDSTAQRKDKLVLPGHRLF
ncbi:unnamed protein product [Pleuronectes platessa]|uniref:Uncharacterized protein n=1 Tax=Pleuronectes platessa TaxID=8262 RepID=A0A9N7TIN4_PLEPL|nr:unnamed protein product [Pleuronectes platessa]